MNGDRDSFIAAIIARPDDDLPRLIFADWLDENGETERAEFIRVQCELARLSKSHHVVIEPCVCLPAYGPDYYSLTGGEVVADGCLLSMVAKVGDRVDVMKPDRRKPRYGLRVVKILEHEIVCCTDAQSQPSPAHKLRARERELLTYLFIEDLPGTFTGGGSNMLIKYDANGRGIDYHFRRGFVEECRLQWEQWVRLADAICKATPLRKVKLTTWPQLEHQQGPMDDGAGLYLSAVYHGIQFEFPSDPRRAARPQVIQA